MTQRDYSGPATGTDSACQFGAIRDLLATARTTKVDARTREGFPCHWSAREAAAFGIYGAIYRCVPTESKRAVVVSALRAHIPEGEALAPHTDALADADLLALIDRSTR